MTLADISWLKTIEGFKQACPAFCFALILKFMQLQMGKWDCFQGTVNDQQPKGSGEQADAFHP